MPTGHSKCRICGKPIPSAYRSDHEKNRCLKIRFDRGDSDVVARVLLKELPKPVRCEKPVEPGQLRLFAVAGPEIGGNYP
jgi:hypothetical protein